jgi:hypothetical protein
MENNYLASGLILPLFSMNRANLAINFNYSTTSLNLDN